MQSREEIFVTLRSALVELFELDAERVTLEASLYEDLEIDSIDAVDLIVQLKPMLGGNLRPEAFKSVRSVQDVVDALHAMMHGGDGTTAGA